jgi:anti-sigma factor RsiW
MSACHGLKNIALYHDGRLSLTEQRAVEAHLLICPECAIELEDLESISKQFENARLPGASPGLVDRLHSRAEDLDRILLTRFVARLTAISAAALVAIGICLTIFGHNSAHSRASLASWEQSAIAPELNGSNSGTEGQFVEFVAQDLSGGRP